MKLILLLSGALLVSSTLMAQRTCGTMENLDHLRNKDPMLDKRHADAEVLLQQWIKDHPDGIGMERKTAPAAPKNFLIPSGKTANRQVHQGNGNKTESNNPCPYDNLLYDTLAVPTVVNQTTTKIECWAGDLIRGVGFVNGSTYAVYTCPTPTFDSQLTIYPEGGGAPLLDDDDGCQVQGGPSFLQFTMPFSGNLDILLDKFECLTEQTIFMELSITLVATAGGGTDTGEGNPATQALLEIPVVVHVLYKEGEENISDAQIQTQMDALNRSFRKTNSDTTLNPAPFAQLSADYEIRFCLAKRDPNDQPTTGITRTQTSVVEFQLNGNQSMKFTSQGGHDNWNPQHYLNLWCCNLGSGLLGYAQFPADLAAEPATDGVVISYKYFGVTSVAQFNLGRTAVHEVGHWLNLRHIWGDGQCASDSVRDRPTQEDKNFNCPTFPHVTCLNGPNGDMFMNYMDYVDDACLHMFTTGQKTRSWAAINTMRSGLLQSSGCTTVGIDEQNFFENYSVYPNPANDEIIIISDFPATDVTVEIYNTLGEKVISDRMINGEKIMNVSSLASGIYVIALSNDKVRGFKKIVVN